MQAKGEPRRRGIASIRLWRDKGTLLQRNYQRKFEQTQFQEEKPLFRKPDYERYERVEKAHIVPTLER